MNFDWIKTSKLPRIVRMALSEGEFDDCLTGIGTLLRGSLFDSAAFTTALKFVEKVGEAHHAEMEEEQEKLEKEEDEREIRNQTALKKLNKFRHGGQDRETTGLPPPPGLKASQQKKIP